MSNTLGPWPVVQNGSQGHPIRTLKFLLRARGHNLAVDGIMTADGVVVPQTWSALIIQVKKGNSGDAVRGVQEEFQFRSGEPGKGLKVDGIFGPQTDSTVRGFQHALSLDIPSVIVDGIVGPVTWQALVSGMLSG
jgi:peptidoglycan hydrolase-like protein with peptidoglycan-binding domain